MAGQCKQLRTESKNPLNSSWEVCWETSANFKLSYVEDIFPKKCYVKYLHVYA